jgi:hypothetical protein
MLIRYYGHVGCGTGYGDAANEMCMSLLSAGAELEIATDGKRLSGGYLPLVKCVKDQAAMRHPDVVVVHTLPVSCGEVFERLGPLWKGPNAPAFVAYTTWEGDGQISPQVAHALIDYDQIWVPCRANKASMRHMNNVVVIPHAFDEAQPRTPPRAVEPGETYRFYYIGAWCARKNPRGLIHAYMAEFTADDNVELVMLCAGASPQDAVMAQLETGIAPREIWPRLRFITERVDDDGLVRMHTDNHCFVTATRGEAWNLPAFQAMLAGRLVIAPCGLGSDDYLREKSEVLLYGSQRMPALGDVRTVAAPDGIRATYVGPQGMTAHDAWREPSLYELGMCMRTAATKRVSVVATEYDVAGRFGRKAVGRLAMDALTELLKEK